MGCFHLSFTGDWTSWLSKEVGGWGGGGWDRSIVSAIMVLSEVQKPGPGSVTRVQS